MASKVDDLPISMNEPTVVDWKIYGKTKWATLYIGFDAAKVQYYGASIPPIFSFTASTSLQDMMKQLSTVTELYPLYMKERDDDSCNVANTEVSSCTSIR